MISREDSTEASLIKFIMDSLPSYGYGLANNGATPPPGAIPVNVREAFPTIDERTQELRVTQLALGFNWDDGGTEAEIGSDLYRFLHKPEWWVFATTPEIAKNLAAVVRHMLLSKYVIDVHDYNDPALTVVGTVRILNAARHRQVAVQPRPWDMNVYTVTATAEDFHNLSEF